VFAALDRGVVLFIVYTVFCDAFYTHLFDKFGAAELWWTAAASVALFVLSLAVAHALARWLAIDEDERIAVMFLGSTKSLAIGVPMAAVVFAARDNLGAVLLPLLLYHPLQLLLGGALAARLRDRPSGPARSIP
jgi:sodium/bile acid cotransporter 7